ncbi:MAG: hypothetical protein WAQ29_12990 [Nitrososphaeraceae archaeon]
MTPMYATSTTINASEVGREEEEIKGGLAELHKRGIKVTSYTESRG